MSRALLLLVLLAGCGGPPADVASFLGKNFYDVNLEVLEWHPPRPLPQLADPAKPGPVTEGGLALVRTRGVEREVLVLFDGDGTPSGISTPDTTNATQRAVWAARPTLFP